MDMDNRAEVREFLMSRRAKITPQQAGLPEFGNRRVPGLRRGEVATLAGVSIEYYSKLERGGLAGVSASVLDAIARALASRRRRTGASIQSRPRCRRHQRRHAPPSAPRQALGAAAELTMGPRPVHRPGNRAQRPHGLAGGQSPWPGNALVVIRQRPPAGPQTSRATPSSTRTPTASTPTGSKRPTPAWPSCAPKPAATPTTSLLHDLVGELSTRSTDFRRRWGAHNVRYHGAGSKTFHHQVVGDLELAYESVDMISEPGLTLTLYAAEPASPTAHALDLLASWTASQNTDTAHPTITST